jgi:anti-sigma-K factor RskA
MTTVEIHSLLGAYVLDAVDDLERHAFERHLRDCDDCRTDVDELRETAARLADGAWSVPPPRLRDNVLAEVGRTRQGPPRKVAAPIRRASRRWRLTAAAAVLVAAAGAGTTAYAVQDHRVRDQRVAAEAARSSEARLRGILASPDLKLHEQPVRGGGRVTVASSRLNDAGVIMLAAAATPADGRVYQLWTLSADGAATSAGVLGAGQTEITQVVDDLRGAAGVGVTVEPAGGSAQPTKPIVAAVQLS